MSWPLSQDYNEAIQDPPNSFSDAELKTGEVVANALGIPMPRSGNFADVYEVRCPNGSRWAVKCFTREVSGLRERYHEISKFLRQANLPFMVDFQYLEQGVHSQFVVSRLKMQWVEGFVLNEFVRDNLDKKPVLNALGQIWLRMARRLREAKLAHCDLQHGNVLFVPGSTANSLAVKLIDYDGMCVPALVGTKSGEVGHPAFQHPERLRTGAYNQEVDRFSLLSIAAGLRCLTVGGRTLWDKYDNGDNLLFRQSDLQKPTESPLFQELLAIREPQTQALVKELYTACRGPLDAVPLVTDLLPEEKPVTKITTAPTAAAPPIVTRLAEVESSWDFQEEEEEEEDETPRRSLKKKRRKKRKTAGWIWAVVGGAAALLLVGVGVGVGLGLRKEPAEKAIVPVAQNKTETKTPQPAKPPVDNGSRKPPKEPQLGLVNDNNNPPLPDSPERGSSSPIFRLTPTGDALALANDERGWSWKLIEPSKNKPICTFNGHTGAIIAIAIAPDGKLAVTAAEDKILRVWDTQNGRSINWCPIGDKKIVQVALTPDGRRVAWTDGGKIVNVYNFENKTSHTYSHLYEVSCVAFAPDGRYLFGGCDQAVANNGEVLHGWSLKGEDTTPLSYRGDVGRVCGIAVSPDGKYLATAHAGERGSVSLWEMQTGKVVCTVPDLPSASSRELIFSPDSRFLLAESGNSYRVFRVGPTLAVVLKKERIPEFDRVSAAFTADSRNVIFVYGKGNLLRRQRMSVPAVLVGNTAPNPAPAETVVVKPPLRKSRRQPVPEEAAVEAAHRDIRSKHKAEYDNGNRGQLINVLFMDLNVSRNDPPRHFALLREIRDASAESNVRSGLGQAQSMAGDFDVDALNMQCYALERSLRSLRPQPAEFVEVGLPLLDRAIAEENYDALTRLMKIVEPAATALRPDDPKRAMAIPVLSQAKRVKQEYAKLQPERKALETALDDPKANLALGKFHCAIRGDWGEGLPMLARGSDSALKALAEKDLANPVDPAAEIVLATDWRKYAASQANPKSLLVQACRKRAYSWYQQAAVQLKGDKLKDVQRSLASLAKIPELQNPWWQFGIYSNAKFDATTGYLRLLPPNGMTTREYYRGPIDITVGARSATVDLHISIGAGGRLIVDQDFTTKKDRLQVFRPDRTPNTFGTRVKQLDVELSINRPYTVRWQVTEAGMKVWLDGKLVIEESRDDYNLSDKYAVSIATNSQPIEIKTATVRRGPE